MYKSIFYVLLMISSMLLNACGKSQPAPQSSLKDKLMGTWKVKGVRETANNTPLYQDPLPSGENNREDFSNYRLSFRSATDYTLVSKDNSTLAGEWELASNETKILFDRGLEGKEKTYTIIALQEGSLKVSFTESSVKTGNRELQLHLVAL